ncbi:nuclear transport factor 2 family protein [Mycobacterium sp. Aquia_213]|uniref:Rv0361 family membrane protein n=1 Tax=Mycobacterium sp. Aquia_213 TaxID=2991728 RepID=UPI00226DE71C|nr:nuclear transport factor 2 family protein [Mycobacterium sp. Aquia_213]WAC93385.1 nuclear transport factor 2 family protein [Mycobacterium sp. Aquia_213]
MNTFAPVMARLWAIGVAAALAASCTTVTGGSAQPQRGGVSTSLPAAAPSGGPATPAPSATPSAQDQIRETLMAFQDAYNTQNWDAYLELMCTAMRTQFSGTAINYVKKSRAQNGVTTIKNITNIAITGDTADATFEGQNETLGTRTVSLPLKLEDGWKICKV